MEDKYTIRFEVFQTFEGEFTIWAVFSPEGRSVFHSKDEQEVRDECDRLNREAQ
jgi:hypothetical protein